MLKILYIAVFAVIYFFVFSSPSLAANTWQKYPNNPIINIEQQSWKSSHAWSPFVMKIDQAYQMWYAGYDGNYWRIGNASSTDGINWLDNINNPIIDNSSVNENVTEPTLIFHNGTYKMWYVSVNRQNNQSAIKYATSNDGIHWSTSVTVLTRIQGWENNYLAHPEISLLNNEYRIFYSGDSGGVWRIGYANSTDGINWNKYQNNPILNPSSNESPTVGGSSIMHETGKYIMYYHSNHPPNKINIATSIDGANWTRDTTNPILTTSLTGFDKTMIAGPTVIKDGDLYKMWYSGFNGSKWQIGYATKSADLTSLNVPLFKQTDPLWENQEYDSASLWGGAKITIGDWGCAMTSAAMVLNFYGINKLPDGTNLDPETLNTWLKNETDGYIGEGLVNWLAVSRLSKLAKTINNITSFDALEYKRISGENKSQLTEDLENSIPGILEQPGHFIVAKGVNGDTFDINDPAYDRLTLNDNYDNTFLSLGRYVPSFTNLSYLMLTINPSFDILISSPSGQRIGSNGVNNYNEIPGASYYTQAGTTNPETGISSASLKILMIPTPTNTDYTLTVATTSAASYPFSLKTYRYTTIGSAEINQLSGYSRSDESAAFSVPYQQNDSALDIEDTTPPQMISAKTLDKDKNGKLDTIKITFARDIYGSTVNPTGTDFTVEDYTVSGADETEAGIVEITLEEKTINDTGQLPEVTLTGDGDHIGIKDLTSKKYNNTQTITPIDKAAPSKPAVNISGGDYYSSQSATLTSSDNPNSATIYYTLDETDPAASSSKLTYNSPIIINDDLTLKAIAKDSSNNWSEILTQTYGIAPTIHANTVSATASVTSFTVVWTTNRPSFSRVIFGKESKRVLGSGTKFGYEKTTTETRAKTTNHSVTISGLTPGTTYYYRALSKGSPEQIGDEKSIAIAAESSESSSSSSSETSSSSSSSLNSSSSTSSASAPVCNDQKPTSTPTLLFAHAGINTVTLEWKEASDPLSYYLITYGTESNKPLYGNPDIGGKGTTSFIVKNLSGGVTYYFKIRAGNGCMPGDYSNEISATPIGFAEEGLAEGFGKGVLGSLAQQKTEKTIPAVNGTSKNKIVEEKETLVLSSSQKQIVAVFALIFISGIAFGAYIKKRAN